MKCIFRNKAFTFFRASMDNFMAGLWNGSKKAKTEPVKQDHQINVPIIFPSGVNNL